MWGGVDAGEVMWEGRGWDDVGVGSYEGWVGLVWLGVGG